MKTLTERVAEVLHQENLLTEFEWEQFTVKHPHTNFDELSIDAQEECVQLCERQSTRLDRRMKKLSLTLQGTGQYHIDPLLYLKNTISKIPSWFRLQSQ